MVVLNVAVVRGASQPYEPTETVAGGERSLRARHRVLEAIAVLGIQDPVPNRGEIGPERVRHGLRDVHPSHFGLGEVRRAGERQRTATEPAGVSGNEIDACGPGIDGVGEKLRGGDTLPLERSEDTRDDRVAGGELARDHDPAVDGDAV